MNCSYCKQAAEFKCNRQKPYMCPYHLGVLLKTSKNHVYETMDTELGELRLGKVRLRLISHIKKINLIKIGINTQTKSLIKSIEGAFIQATRQLESIKNNYIELLKRYKFFASELPDIEKIELFDIKFKTIKIDGISSAVKNTFSQELITYEKMIENRENLFLFKHNGGFRCGAITTDYKTLVSGGADAVIRVWDLAHNIQKFILLGHNSAIQCIVLTGDNQHIISGSYDASVRIWDIEKKSQSALLKAHKGGVHGICYIENRSLIVSADDKNEIIIWDFPNRTIKQRANLLLPIWTILVKNENCIIAGALMTIAFIGVDSLSIERHMEGHTNNVFSLVLTSDGRRLVSGSQDCSIIIWDLIKYKKINQLFGHLAPICSLALTDENSLIISGSDDTLINVWNMNDGKKVVTYQEHRSFVNTILRANEEFISLSADSSIGRLSLNTGLLEITLPLKPFKHEYFEYLTESNLIGFGCYNEAIVWNLEREAHTSVLLGHKYDVKSVEISKDGQFALTCSSGNDENLIYWDIIKNQKIAVLNGHTNIVFCACFSNDGLIAASGSCDKTVRTWNLSEYKQQHRFRGHDDAIYSIKFINKKNLLVSGGKDMKLIIWNLKDKSQYNVLRGHNQTVWRVIITEDEKFIISGDVNDGIRIWNVEKKNQEFIFCFQENASNWLKHNGIPIESVRRFLKA